MVVDRDFSFGRLQVELALFNLRICLLLGVVVKFKLLSHLLDCDILAVVTLVRQLQGLGVWSF